MMSVCDASVGYGSKRAHEHFNVDVVPGSVALDFGNQVSLVRLAKELARDRGLGVVMTTHNPNHLFMCEGAGVRISPRAG